VASSPRIDELRRRLERDPESRLFAQLAEELRKAGELEEAIAVTREGLKKHPTYPSARMTLGRALFDAGDLAAARVELEAVLGGAPDNILASRLLGQCLEGLGDAEGAVSRYRATAAMAPGDPQVAALLEAAARKVAAGPARPAPPAQEPTPLVEALEEDIGGRAAPEPAPIPLVAVDEEFELERPYESAATQVNGSAEAADEGLEIEPPYESPATLLASGTGVGGTPMATLASEEAPLPRSDAMFELDAPDEAAGQADAGFVDASALSDRPPEGAGPVVGPPPARLLVRGEGDARPPWVETAEGSKEAGPEPSSPIASSTLAELYLDQGAPDKALEVYRQILRQEPGNTRIETRVRELERFVGGVAEATDLARGAAPGSVQKPRREALERTIGRLETLLAALKRG
jgi:tetratricopeptide (TPR) repeat protein